ncbi:MAG: ChaN family lipoprotein [Bryobacterales bacterium]|nr:ChaN family lipoprotein [Bryobacterales bacterium]MBV9401901.1 ChaN family lipoprotein [Bryobacterales bacterium]
MEAIAAALVSMFDQADIVALGEQHEWKPDSDVRIALVRHADFAKKVRSIVVEFGSASHQAMLDRYIRGEDVPRAELEQVWKTTQVGGGGSSIYPAFFAAVRDVNSRLPADARVRVFGAEGEPGRNGETTAVTFLKQQVLQKHGKSPGDLWPRALLAHLPS